MRKLGQEAVIGLIDDDPGQRKAVTRILSLHGYAVLSYASAEAYLQEGDPLGTSCLILDLAMPGLGGMGLLQKLREDGNGPPVIFLSGEGDIPTAVQAIKDGAAHFLTKPVDVSELLEALESALTDQAEALAQQEALSELRTKFDQLTPRETEVLKHVITGKLNKQIAADLNISEQTVKVHRMRLTEKTGLPSVAELVRAAGQLEIPPAGTRNVS